MAGRGSLREDILTAAEAVVLEKGAAHLTLEARLPLAPARPTVNSILHLFGGWLFEAALSGVKVHGSGPGGELVKSGNLC